MNVAVVTPAYGRDYIYKRSVLADFRDGKDFIMENIMDKYCGKPCNIEDLKKAGYTRAQIRYNKKTRVVFVELV
jgi:hypothetical protein